MRAVSPRVHSARQRALTGATNRRDVAAAEARSNGSASARTPSVFFESIGRPGTAAPTVNSIRGGMPLMGITDLQSQTTERSMLLCETLPGSTQSSTRPMTAPMPKKNDIVPLKALRPDFERPTMLEIGPAMVPAVGSDLVRTMDAAPGASTRPATARETTRTKDDLIGDGKSRKHSSQAIAAGTKVGGHAEAVLSVMREFFLTRPLGVMLEVFKNQDTDNSGSVDVDEFKVR